MIYNRKDDAHLESMIIHAYAAAQVGRGQEFAVEQHLLKCAACRRRVAVASRNGTMAGINSDRLQSMWHFISAAIDVEDAVNDLHVVPTSEVVHRITSPTLRTRRSASSSRSRVLLTSAVAALVVAIVALAILPLTSGVRLDGVAQPSSSEITDSLHGGPIPDAPQLPAGLLDLGRAPLFQPTDYIAVVWWAGPNNNEAYQGAEEAQELLLRAGVPASILPTYPFPDMLLLGYVGPIPERLVYVGPFTTQSDASAFCALLLPARCLVAQPNPKG